MNPAHPAPHVRPYPSQCRGMTLSRRRGTMSIVIVILALTATAMITATLSLTTGATTVQRRALMREQAVFLADSGFERAMIQLRNDPAWRTGYTDQPLGQGAYTVTLTDDNGDVVITSTGTVGALQSQVSMRVGWE